MTWQIIDGAAGVVAGCLVTLIAAFLVAGIRRLARLSVMHWYGFEVHGHEVTRHQVTGNSDQETPGHVLIGSNPDEDRRAA